MGKKKQSPGGRGGGFRGRGRAQVEGRGGGRSRGREQMHSGDTSRTGFVLGGALGDWESATPDRRQSSGRGGRTPEGANVGPRHPVSSNRRGSQGRPAVTRPAQNFVSFDYTQLEGRRGSAAFTPVNNSRIEEVSASPVNYSRIEEISASPSGEREVVVPAIEGRVEVYIDRKGCVEALDAVEIRTTGLGFVEQESAEELGNDHKENTKVTPSTKKDRKGRSFEDTSGEGRNAGYISIGGVKIYTEAGDLHLTDDSEEGLDECVEPYSKNRRRKRGQQRGQWLEDTFSESGESVVDSSDDSDVDDDLVEDYMANVEGAEEMLDSNWLLKNSMHHAAVEDMDSDDNSEEDEDDIACSGSSDQDSSGSGGASPERMWRQKRQSKGKELMDIDDDDLDSELEDMVVFGEHVRKTKTTTLLKNLELEDSEEDSEDEDDIDQLFDVMEDSFFTPDKILSASGTGKQKVGSIGKSLDPAMWPTSVLKTTKKAKKVPGQKKRERKEMIAIKRQERALQRGLDLQAINSALENIVERGTEIYAFAPMEDRDRAQIHKMAAMYRLKSGSQGSGKKRFTVVTRTKHTSLPTGADKYRLFAMLDRVDGNSSGMPLTGEDRRMAKKFKNAARQAFLTMQTPTPNRKKNKKFEPLLHKSKSKKAATSAAEKSGAKKMRTPKYANNPMSFISCGTMVTENDATTTPVGLGASSSRSKVAASFTTIGTFEAHTKGFGSRIMSRMGFVEGGGLGRDGQGINSPLEAVKRPKSLGLGAYAPPPPPSA